MRFQSGTGWLAQPVVHNNALPAALLYVSTAILPPVLQLRSMRRNSDCGELTSEEAVKLFDECVRLRSGLLLS